MRIQKSEYRVVVKADELQDIVDACRTNPRLRRFRNRMEDLIEKRAHEEILPDPIKPVPQDRQSAAEAIQAFIDSRRD